MSPLRVSVVVPALNEAANLPWVLGRIPDEYEVVLVDGGSSDDTVAVARRLRPDIVVVGQEYPGKGAALVAGMQAAGGDYIVMIDADASMDPAEIAAFVGILDSGADLVKGSRYLAGAGSEDLTLLRSTGNRALTVAGNLLYRTNWSELCYGYAAFRRSALDRIGIDGLAQGVDPGPAPRWWVRRLGGTRRVRYGHGFEIEAILFTRCAKAGLRVCEAPSYERDRLHGQSNLATFRDGARVLGALLWERRPQVWRRRMQFSFPARPATDEVAR
jgi:glycosyltransferase involved in cell wall biosynthesis